MAAMPSCRGQEGRRAVPLSFGHTMSDMAIIGQSAHGADALLHSPVSAIAMFVIGVGTGWWNPSQGWLLRVRHWCGSSLMLGGGVWLAWILSPTLGLVVYVLSLLGVEVVLLRYLLRRTKGERATLPSTPFTKRVKGAVEVVGAGGIAVDPATGGFVPADPEPHDPDKDYTGTPAHEVSWSDDGHRTLTCTLHDVGTGYYDRGVACEIRGPTGETGGKSWCDLRTSQLRQGVEEEGVPVRADEAGPYRVVWRSNPPRQYQPEVVGEEDVLLDAIPTELAHARENDSFYGGLGRPDSPSVADPYTRHLVRRGRTVRLTLQSLTGFHVLTVVTCKIRSRWGTSEATVRPRDTGTRSGDPQRVMDPLSVEFPRDFVPRPHWQPGRYDVEWSGHNMAGADMEVTVPDQFWIREDGTVHYVGDNCSPVPIPREPANPWPWEASHQTGTLAVNPVRLTLEPPSDVSEDPTITVEVEDPDGVRTRTNLIGDGQLRLQGRQYVAFYPFRDEELPGRMTPLQRGSYEVRWSTTQHRTAEHELAADVFTVTGIGTVE